MAARPHLLRAAILAALAVVAGPVLAQRVEGAWLRGQGQGFTEYSLGTGNAWISVGCDEAATLDGSGTGIYLELGSGLPPAHSTLVFDIDGHSLTVPSGASGGVSLQGSPEIEPALREILGRMLTGRVLTVTASNGHRGIFPLDGFAALVTPPCKTPAGDISPVSAATAPPAAPAAPQAPPAGEMQLGAWTFRQGATGGGVIGRAEDGATILRLACDRRAGARLAGALTGYAGAALERQDGAQATLALYFVTTDATARRYLGPARYSQAEAGWTFDAFPLGLIDVIADGATIVIGNDRGEGVARFDLAHTIPIWPAMRAACGP